MLENKNPDGNRFPVLTLLLVLGSLLIFLLPSIANYLVYDREYILAGEWWRVLTAVGVHFSWSHLVYNIVILLLAGWLLERESRSHFVWLVLITSVLSSLYFLFYLPEMKNYAGLSGIISAIAVFVCLMNIRKVPKTKWLWITILTIFIAKVIYEGVMQEAFYVSYASEQIHVVPSAHIIGAMVAIVMVSWSFLKEKYQH